MSKSKTKSLPTSDALRQTWKVFVEDVTLPGVEQETHVTDASLVDAAAVERFVEDRWPHFRFLRAERVNKFRCTMQRDVTLDVDAPMLSHAEVKERAGEFVPLGQELRRVISCTDGVMQTGARPVKVHKLTLELSFAEIIGPGDFDLTTAGNEAARRNPGWMVGAVELVEQFK